MKLPGGWDGESRCVVCGRPATHERPVGVARVSPWIDEEEAALIVELVCADHDTD